MPWKCDPYADPVVDEFGSPDYDTGPAFFYAQNALNLVAAQQSKAITWWNNRWKDVIGYTLQPIPASQFFIGEQLNLNARSLTAIIDGEIFEKDSYEEQRYRINFIYLSGDAQLTGIKGAIFAPVIVASFYLEMIKSILQTAPSEKLTIGWPSDTPANVVKFLRIQRPAVLVMDLIVNPYPIPRGK